MSGGRWWAVFESQISRSNLTHHVQAIKIRACVRW